VVIGGPAGSKAVARDSCSTFTLKSIRTSCRTNLISTARGNVLRKIYSVIQKLETRHCTTTA